MAFADLMLKIGADSSGLSKELKKAKGDINSTFSTSPITGFTDALTGTSGALDSFSGKIANIAALAGAGFGFTQLISGAVEAGKRVHDLAQNFNITNAEASMFARTIKLAGGDVDSVSKVLMKLDKTITDGGTSADNINKILAAVGSSVTDANGKLLPLNQQMEQLAKGYDKASEAGYGQEYILETLGAKGAALIDVLRDYNEASQNAQKIQGIGLDADQMDQASKQIDLLKTQAGQLGLVTGAALTPIVEQYIPPLLNGLGQLASLIAENKNQVIDLTDKVVTFLAVYKGVSTISSIGSSIASKMQELTAVSEMEATVSAEDERRINRRIALVQQAALKEERAYYKTLEAENLTDEEKARKFAAYCAEREARAIRTEAVLREELTKSCVQASAQMEASAAQQSASLATVSGAAAVTSKSVATVGSAAAVSGAKMTTMATGSIGVITRLTKAVWLLAGGWVGVAAAIGYAAVKMYNFYQQERKKAANDTVYTYNGKNYQYDAEDNTMVRLKDNGTRMNVYSQEENDAAFAAAREQGLKLPGEENNDEAQPDDGSAALDDTLAKLQEALANIDTNTEKLTKATGEGRAASAAAVPKTYTAEVPIGEIAAQNAIDEYTNNPGAQWLNPELTKDMGRSCAAFVATMWKNAGIESLYSASGSNMDQQFKDAEAWHPDRSYYTPSPGDYVSGPDHVGMYVGNGNVISRDSQGGLQMRSLEDWKNTFGFLGYGSIGEYTGGRTGTMTVGEDGRAAVDAMKKLEDAKRQAIDMYKQMQTEISQENDTTYQSGLNQLQNNITGKMQQIQKLAAAGLPDDSIDILKKKVDEYNDVMQNKLMKQQKEALQSLLTETKRVNAETMGNYYELADAEYEATVESLQKQREEKGKEVAKNQEDKESMAAIEDWYTAQVEAANEKREESYREAFENQMKYAIDHGNESMATDLMNSSAGQEYLDWKGKTDQMQEYYSLWEEANMSIEEINSQMMSSLDSGLESIFSNLVSDLGNAKNLVKDLGNLVLNTIAKIAIKMAAARLVTSIFGGGSSDSSFSSASTGWMDRMMGSFSFSSFASGGVVTAPTLSLIGEAGDNEAVLPLNDNTYSNIAKGISNNGVHGGTVVYVNNYSNESVNANTTSDGDSGAEIVNITIGELAKNTDGSLDTLKDLLGR